MKLLLIIIFLSVGLAGAQEKKSKEILLDKIVAVVNSKIISLSEIKRMESTLKARTEISPMIYSQKKYSKEDLLNIMIRSFIIRDKINAQGYVINDDAVENRITMTEQRLGLQRSDLLQFLKSKGITFEEYFEIIRETMEFNIFVQRIIAPLVSITEQEIKNEYYRRNSTNNALAFKYDLVDFYISNDKIQKGNEDQFLSILKDYQLTGKLPSDFSDLETNNLENLSAESLPKKLSSVLKITAEGSFSKPVILNNYLHVFYVQKKDLVESQEFLRLKDSIQNEIFLSKGKSVTDNWFSREYSNYYIKNLL